MPIQNPKRTWVAERRPGILWIAPLVAGVFYAISHEAYSDSSQESTLTYIADFAKDFCVELPLSGDGESVTIDASAKAKVRGLIKKLADFGIEGSIDFSTSEYFNVLQEDLGPQLVDMRKCKLIIWEDLKDRIPGLQRAQSDPDLSGRDQTAVNVTTTAQQTGVGSCFVQIQAKTVNVKEIRDICSNRGAQEKAHILDLDATDGRADYCPQKQSNESRLTGECSIHYGRWMYGMPYGGREDGRQQVVYLAGRYIGDYVNNNPNGNGEFILTNETMGDLGFFRTFTSDGMWEHGDEIVVTGEWRKGGFTGNDSVLMPNGGLLKGRFYNGILMLGTADHIPKYTFGME